MLRWDYLNEILAEKRESWAKSGPTRYVIIDNFLNPEDCSALNNIKGIERKLVTPASRTHKHVRGKSGTPNKANMTELQRTFFEEINSDIFVKYIQDLTGITPLYADDELMGGGLHLTRPGGYLNVHTDFNFQPSTQRHRRLNLLLYLNKEWQDAWNGHIELWDVGIERPFLRSAPLFNRVLMFETSENSYHGHPDPLKTPPGVFRVSLAVYYYADWPEGLEQRPQTGYQLTRRQWASLMTRIAALYITSPGLNDDGVVAALEIDFMTQDIRIACKALRQLVAMEGVESFAPQQWTELLMALADLMYSREVTIDDAVEALESSYSAGNVRAAFQVLKSLRSALLRGERYWEYPDGTYSLEGPEKVA